MLDLVYRVVTWGLLGIFVSFFAFGTMIAAYTLVRFYLKEFTKLANPPPSK